VARARVIRGRLYELAAPFRFAGAPLFTAEMAADYLARAALVLTAE